MRLTLASLAAVIALGFPGLQCAYADAPPSPRSGDAVVGDRQAPAAWGPHLEVVDESAQRLPTFYQGGRQFVLGSMGGRYQVRVVNPTGARIEAVVSVDGLDAVDGRPASLNKRGYIIPAYGEVVIDGFRTSLDAVAAFRFSSVRDSYAAKTSHARNVGVIGVAFFRERPPPVVRRYPPPVYQQPSTSPAMPEAAPPPADAAEAGGAMGSARAERAAPSPATRPGLGTQFGETRESHVVETTFVRGDTSPNVLLEIRYDDREGLLARGIDLSPPRDPRDAENDLRDSARAFPQSRFAQPPPR
jgi:hypothetical protein